MERMTRILDPELLRPRAPAGEIVYAVGDLHGRLDLLERLLPLIAADAAGSDAKRRFLVFLGDYVDRGPDSRGVIDRLMAGPLDGFEQVCLLGNHEAWLLDFLDDPGAGAGWLMNGGAETLASYGVRAGFGLTNRGRLDAVRTNFLAALPADHRAWLQALPLMWRRGDYAFVHAGVRPGVALDDQDARDLVWIREDFLWSEADFGAVVVHGHSICDAPESLENRICIDTGAFASGRLTCVALEGVERRFLQT